MFEKIQSNQSSLNEPETSTDKSESEFESGIQLPESLEVSDQERENFGENETNGRKRKLSLNDTKDRTGENTNKSEADNL